MAMKLQKGPIFKGMLASQFRIICRSYAWVVGI